MEGGKRSGPTARLAGKVSYTCDGVCVGGGGGGGGEGGGWRKAVAG